MRDDLTESGLSSLFNNLIRNSAKLFGGNFIAMILAFGASVLAARHLGPGGFGLVVIVQTYVLVIDRLINFQSWETLIKFGAAAESAAVPKDEFRNIVSYCWQIDLGTALLGASLAFAGLPILATHYGITHNVLLFAWVYPAVILLNLTGAPIGVLRLRRKVSGLAVASTITGAARLLVALIGTLGDRDVRFFLLGWAIADMGSNLTVLAFGWVEMTRLSVNPFRGQPFWRTAKRHPGIAKFAIISNLHSSIVLACKELDLLIIGSLLGVEGAGLIKVAKQFASIVSKPFDPINQLVYPELAKLASHRDFSTFKALLLKISIGCSLIGACVWTLLFLFGNDMLLLTVGAAFTAAYTVLVLYGIGIALAVIATPLQPAMLSIGLQSQSFFLVLTSSVIYLISIYLAVNAYGLVGAGLAYAIFFGFQVSGMVFLTFRRLRLLAGTGAREPI